MRVALVLGVVDVFVVRTFSCYITRWHALSRFTLQHIVSCSCSLCCWSFCGPHLFSFDHTRHKKKSSFLWVFCHTCMYVLSFLLSSTPSYMWYDSFLCKMTNWYFQFLMTHKGFYFFEFVFFVVLAIPFWIALATPYSPPALRFATYCNASALNVPTVNNKPPARSRVLQCRVLQ